MSKSVEGRGLRPRQRSTWLRFDKLNRKRPIGWLRRGIHRGYLRPLALPIGRHLNTVPMELGRMLDMAFSYVSWERIPGDYAEFGVFDGGTFLEAWQAVQRYGLTDVCLHAYDSFAGLPEVTGTDSDGSFRPGDFASSRLVFDRTTAIIPRERMTVTQGFFRETLPVAEQHPLAVVLVDCDLYTSTVPVLDFLTGQLQNGTVLIFDDWFCFRGRPDRGEQLACAEWLAQHPEFSLQQYRDFHWAGRAFIVRRD
jgi:O-methyltransferase